MLQLLEGPDYGHATEGLKEKKKAPGKNRTHYLRLRVLYRCATTAALAEPFIEWVDKGEV